MSFIHPGHAWKTRYAYCGITANDQGIEPGSQDRYNATERGIVDASNPSTSSRMGQTELEREGGRVRH